MKSALFLPLANKNLVTSHELCNLIKKQSKFKKKIISQTFSDGGDDSDYIFEKKFNYKKKITKILNYKKKNISSFKKYSKSLYVVKIKKLNPNSFIEKSKWGFFYECNINDLKEIGFTTNRSLQTLTYFGFLKKDIKTLLEEKKFNGIDRAVPIGQALNINLIWDGYDLSKILSREVEIR